MAEVTAALVRDLREKTGAGMMDCKKALDESGGDIEKAIEWLRKKGLSSAAKRAGKAAKEGAIEAQVSFDGKTAVLVEVNCETDFVARNEEFRAFARQIATHILETAPASQDALLTSPLGGRPVSEVVAEKAAKMGENVQVTRFVRLRQEGPGLIASYIHANGKIGVLVQLALGDESLADKPEIKQFANDLALHVASEAPAYLRRSEIPAEVVAKEKDIARSAAKQEGKPDNIIEKIVEGKLNKYFQEVCLLEQKFFRGDNPPSIEKLLGEKSKALGGKIDIVRFVRFVLGETTPKGE